MPGAQSQARAASMQPLGTIKNKGASTPFSPPSGPATGSFNGLHAKSKFLAALHAKSKFLAATLAELTLAEPTLAKPTLAKPTLAKPSFTEPTKMES